MGKDTGFIEYEKQNVPRRVVEERVGDFAEYDLLYDIQDIQRQASRCMDCGVPFCHTGCPLGNLIPDWNDLVYRGQWKEALDMLHSTNNFPEFTGRICPAPCEESCVLNEHYTLDPEEKENKKNAVTIEQVEKHIAERGWQEGWIHPEAPSSETGKRIGIVGSGPAGLAAAQQLRRAGHHITVFEKDDRPGGLLVYGIPDFKLTKDHVNRRIKQMKKEGVVFRTGIEAGRDLRVKDLRKQFDALLIAMGTQEPRRLEVEGADLKGVHYAMDYLPQCNRVVAQAEISSEEKIDTVGKRAVILGGGFTAADCLGNLNRQGVHPEIHQFELVDMVPRPTPVHEETRINCRANILTEKLSGTPDGFLNRIQAVRVQWNETELGQRMNRLKGSEFSLKTDLVLLAMGFLGPKLEGLLQEMNLELDVRGREEALQAGEVAELLKSSQPIYQIRADRNFMTSCDGVFVAGDAKRGASLVVWAIWEGREAARCIDTYLMGKTALPSSPQAEVIA
mgnify:FL=1